MYLSESESDEESVDNFTVQRCALERWRMFILRCSQQQMLMRKSLNEVKTKDVIRRYTIKRDLVIWLREWRVIVMTSRRVKKKVFNYLRKHNLLHKISILYHRNIIREGFMKFRRRSKWSQASVMGLFASRKLIWRRWLRFTKRGIHTTEAMEHATLFQSQYRMKLFFYTVRKNIALQREIRSKDEKYHLRCLDLVRVAFDELITYKRKCERKSKVLFLATNFDEVKKTRHLFGDMLSQWRKKKLRSGHSRRILREMCKRRDKTVKHYQHFHGDTAFLAFGNPLIMNFYQKATLYVGCLSQFSKKTQIWSGKALVFLRYLLQWRRRVLVRVNRRIRLTRAIESCSRKGLRLWQYHHFRFQQAATLYSEGDKCRLFRNWKFWKKKFYRAICLLSFENQGRRHREKKTLNAAVRTWRIIALQSVERKNISTYALKRKAMRSLKRLMWLQRFRILPCRADLRRSFLEKRESLRHWRRYTALRKKVRYFMAVQRRYKHIVQSMKSRKEIADEETKLLSWSMSTWKEVVQRENDDNGVCSVKGTETGTQYIESQPIPDYYEHENVLLNSQPIDDANGDGVDSIQSGGSKDRCESGHIILASDLDTFINDCEEGNDIQSMTMRNTRSDDHFDGDCTDFDKNFDLGESEQASICTDLDDTVLDRDSNSACTHDGKDSMVVPNLFDLAADNSVVASYQLNPKDISQGSESSIASTELDLNVVMNGDFEVHADEIDVRRNDEQASGCEQDANIVYSMGFDEGNSHSENRFSDTISCERLHNDGDGHDSAENSDVDVVADDEADECSRGLITSPTCDEVFHFAISCKSCEITDDTSYLQLVDAFISPTTSFPPPQPPLSPPQSPSLSQYSGSVESLSPSNSPSTSSTYSESSSCVTPLYLTETPAVAKVSNIGQKAIRPKLTEHYENNRGYLTKYLKRQELLKSNEKENRHHDTNS